MVDPIKSGSLWNRSAMCAAVLLLMSSCATLRAPVEPPQFNSAEILRSSAGGIEMGIKPIQGRDAYWELFDDDLPSAGIGALWVSVKNISDSEVDFSRVKWVLRQGRTGNPALTGEQVFKLFYRARHIRMYRAETDRLARLAIERVRFQPGPVGPSMVREGFLFFRVVPDSDRDWIRNGILFAENVRLKEARMSSFQVHLAYANP